MSTNTQFRILVALLVASACASGQPAITRHPVDQSVSLGANASFIVTASGAAPLVYQWHFNDAALPGATNRSLVLTNAAITLAGKYSAVVRDGTGSVTTKVAVLEVDATFTKITSSPVVKDTADGEGAAWVDFDNDGDLDLSVNTDATPAHLLYRNDGTNGFTQVLDGVLSRQATGNETTAWVDFDNDGLLDVFVCKAGGYLFRQDPIGTFTRFTLGAPGVDWGVSAADFDNDGFLDLAVHSTDPKKSVWRNNGSSGFTALTNSPVTTSTTPSIPAADFDNDGDIDLFVSKDRLYQNDGAGSFKPITTGALAQQGLNGTEAAWGDYNNDGFPDLFLGRIDFSRPLASSLYHNNSDGTFTLVEQKPFTDPIGQVTGGSWADYDNDGWLDLFIAEYGPEKNRLFHNNGDGTFTRVLAGSVANDQGSSTAGIWGDYDRDGFLDLFVANGVGGNGGGDSTDYLYRNNGNSNSWITIKPVGTVSNRSAIGTKVRLKATIRGKSFWQLREISTGGGWVQNPLEAHFGLGDASKADSVRIEWPSGTTTELRDVAPRQFLTIIEPPRLSTTQVSDGARKFTLRGGVGFSYVLEASADLTDWLPLQTNTANALTLEFEDAEAASQPRRFYRARWVVR